MRLDTITTIEQFIADALLSSPQIPLGVNVIRLAATTDEEGIAALSRSIVVRYTGSSVSVKQRQPLSIERTMKFELIHSSQSYLTESGHDGALQMCAGAYLSLNNSIPTRTGTQVVVPFSMTSENFDGLTDSSHYVYTQQWEVVVVEINPTISMNPCVLYGNCSQLFPLELVGGVLPGDVIYQNRLYSPIIPPPFGVDYDEEYCGVKEVEGDLVYKYNPDLTFIEDWREYQFVSTDTFVEDTGILICNIKDKEGNQIDTYYAGNCDDRGLLSFTAQLPGGDKTNPSLKGKNGLCYTNKWPKTQVYTDPTEADSNITYVKYGWVLRVDLAVTLCIDYVNYYKVNGPPFGVGWITEGDFTMIREYEGVENCDDLEASNEGPQECE